MKKSAIFLKGLIKENPVLVLLLGTCPTLATTTSVISAARRRTEARCNSRTCLLKYGYFSAPQYYSG